MVTLDAARRSPFSFLFAESRAEQRVATYLLREHRRGRHLGDILTDPYVRNRVAERDVARLLERPELLHALVSDVTDHP